MNVTNVESVTYGVDDLRRSERFWTDFGLARSRDSHGIVRYSAQDGSGVELRSHDDPALPAALAPGNTIREVTFGVRSAADLDAVAKELADDTALTADEDGTLHFTDPLGFPVAVRVSRRTTVVAPEQRYNTPGRPERLNTRGRRFDSARPLELTHAVYMVEETEAIVRFYTERLGFIVSDCYPGRGYFMRGGASSHHHDLFVLNTGGPRGFHHVAFELGSIHELFGGGLNMTKRGWKTAIGPGRHPISSCYFWYFHCPSGGAAEYDFDSDVVDERWVAGSFEQTPEMFAEWCLAEGLQESLLNRGIQTAETVRQKEEDT